MVPCTPPRSERSCNCLEFAQRLGRCVIRASASSRSMVAPVPHRLAPAVEIRRPSAGPHWGSNLNRGEVDVSTGTVGLMMDTADDRPHGPARSPHTPLENPRCRRLCEDRPTPRPSGSRYSTAVTPNDSPAAGALPIRCLPCQRAQQGSARGCLTAALAPTWLDGSTLCGAQRPLRAAAPPCRGSAR